MEWMALLYQIFDLCVIPLLGVLTMYLVQFIRLKSQEITDKTDSDLADKYIQMLTDTITTCVIATNQTYVESLKRQGKFDKEAQKEAFKLTYNAVMAVLTDEAKHYLAAIYGDLTAYITTRIEAEVNVSKIMPVEE
jgi:hypothetical protein